MILDHIEKARRARPAPCLSRLLGRGLAQDGLQGRLSARRSGSATTAGSASMPIELRGSKAQAKGPWHAARESCLDRLARRAARRARPRRHRRLVASADDRPQRRRRNFARAIFPARCSSTSTRSPTSRAACRTCCPTPRLRRAMGALGLGDGMRFVVYDALGLFAAARVWWTLRAFGAATCMILAGGLPKWMQRGPAARERAKRIRSRARSRRGLTAACRQARRGQEGARLPARRRSWTPAPPTASRAARPSRGRA